MKLDCDAPQGYVMNGDDWDDTDPFKYRGAACLDECESTLNESCICVPLDSDNDGICDFLDRCPGEDDNLDSDQNGTPDWFEKYWAPEERDWDTTVLRVKEGEISTTLNFDPPI